MFSNLTPSDTSVLLNYEVYGTCSTYYHSAGKKRGQLARVIGYDKNGLEKKITYIDYESHVPATVVNIYDSSGLKKEEYYLDEDLNIKWTSLHKRLFEYGENGKVARIITFEFTRRMKKGIVRGLGTTGGCIVRPSDYEKKKTWALKFVWNHVYDKEGRLTDYARSYPEHGYQGRYLYKYDDRGRMTEESSLTEGHIFYLDKYKYDDSVYEHTLTTYERDGTIAKNSKGLAKFTLHKCKVDRFNNLIEDRVINEDGPAYRERYYYDEKNRIIRHEFYNSTDKLSWFYVHRYATLEKPMRLTFAVAE
jgi:hypothetical protein